MKVNLTKNNIPSWLVPISFLFYLVLNIISWRFPFFWDTLLTSTICSQFFETGFNGGIPSNEIDAGHPPLFYAYILAWWKVLGRNLQVSHLAMLPILWIMVYQFIQLASRLLQNKNQVILATFLFCIETTILAQSTMVSYDIVILAFYLLGLRYVLDNKKWPVMLAGIVLCLISLRGVFAFGALFITELILFHKERKLKVIVLKYLPAIFIFIAWNFWHLKQSDWMLFATSDHWADQRGFAGLKGMTKNGIVIIRNLLEPGRVALYGFVSIALFFHWRKINPNQLKPILTILLIPLIIFSILFIPFNNPIGHRYLMIVFALSSLLFVSVIDVFKFKNAWITITALVLISGHFWYPFYPDSISKGWDSSLEHVSYFEAKQQVWDYFKENDLEIRSSAASFPLDVSMHQSNLLDDRDKPFKLTKERIYIGVDYIFISNINNNIEPYQLSFVKSNYDFIERFKNGSVYIDLYKAAK